jgi:glycerol-3-phosphate dehydrogenase
VHEALQERARLAQTIAPHLVTPLPFLLPLTAPVWQRAYYGAGVALYDVLGAALTSGRVIPTHRHLSRKATLAAFPGLRGDVVRGSIRYWDAQVDDARHTLAVVRTAAGYGARVLSSARVVGLLRDGRGMAAPVLGARVADLTDGSTFEVRARSVVAATGVWSDDIGAMLGDSAPGLKVRASKGVHLVVPRSAIDGGSLAAVGVTPDGLILRTPTSGRRSVRDAGAPGSASTAASTASFAMTRYVMYFPPATSTSPGTGMTTACSRESRLVSSDSPARSGRRPA